MEQLNIKIWNDSIPYLRKGIKKDYVLHTAGVLRGMYLILEKENGDPSTLLPAAILHDTGWALVPIQLQKSKNKSDRKQANQMHVEYSKTTIQEILEANNFTPTKINDIIEICIAHKSDPEEFEKRLLIDADTLADTFRDQFYSDAKSYGVDVSKYLNKRSKNKFYTKTANKIFKKCVTRRSREIFLNSFKIK